MVTVEAMTPTQRFEFHRKAYAGINKALAEGVDRHMEWARMHRESDPRIANIFVMNARYQNQWMVRNNQALERMRVEGIDWKPTPRPPRLSKPHRLAVKPVVVPEPEEPNPLSPLYVALEVMERQDQAIIEATSVPPVKVGTLPQGHKIAPLGDEVGDRIAKIVEMSEPIDGKKYVKKGLW